MKTILLLILLAYIRGFCGAIVFTKEETTIINECAEKVAQQMADRVRKNPKLQPTVADWNTASRVALANHPKKITANSPAIDGTGGKISAEKYRAFRMNIRDTAGRFFLSSTEGIRDLPFVPQDHLTGLNNITRVDFVPATLTPSQSAQSRRTEPIYIINGE